MNNLMNFKKFNLKYSLARVNVKIVKIIVYFKVI